MADCRDKPRHFMVVFMDFFDPPVRYPVFGICKLQHSLSPPQLSFDTLRTDPPNANESQVLNIVSLTVYTM